jgi:uncharacterized protein (DUF488 family)
VNFISMNTAKNIWTIGHSNHSADVFINILQSFRIELLLDVRRFPGSRKFPQFNKETLQTLLLENNIHYIHMEALGGRRTPLKNSINTAWRNMAFRGYADYTETPHFKNAISELVHFASNKRTAYMCSEAVWWSCHRSMISDYLKIAGWTVMHIFGVGKAQEHPYTSVARVINGKLNYTATDLFNG